MQNKLRRRTNPISVVGDRIKAFSRWLYGFLMNSVGLKWIAILFRGLDEEGQAENRAKNDKELTSLQSYVGKVSSDQSATIIEEIKRLENDDRDREKTIESKAVTLIGSITLASTFIVGVSQLSLSNSIYSSWLHILILALYVFLGCSLFLTISLALKATQVGRYRPKSPSLINLWDQWGQKEGNPDEAYHDQAVTRLYIYIYTRCLINFKAMYVIGAQCWFRNTVVLLFFLSMALGFPRLVSSNQTNTSSVTSTPVLPTQTFTNTPTLLPSLTSTATQSPAVAVTPAINSTP